MINKTHFRHNIVRPVLKLMNEQIPYSKIREDLIMGTAAVESNLGTYLVQMKEGPAKGVYQMEGKTHSDIHDNFLAYREPLRNLVNLLRFSGGEDELVGNLYYATAMASVHYYRVPEKVPASLEGQAMYWKQYYNTIKGEGTPEKYIKHYYKFVQD